MGEKADRSNGIGAASEITAKNVSEKNTEIVSEKDITVPVEESQSSKNPTIGTGVHKTQ